MERHEPGVGLPRHEQPSGHLPRHSGLPPAVYEAEVRLRGLPQVGRLEQPEMERALLGALLGSAVQLAGSFPIYRDIQPDQTVVFVHDASGHSPHKYLIAVAAGRTFIVAAPISWTEYHHDLLLRIEAACGSTPTPRGGGYLFVRRNGLLVVEGESVKYGTGDHAAAQAAFERAIRASRH